MNSSWPIFYSKANLTTRFVDYSNVYLLPTICYFGVITNTICVLATYKPTEGNSKTLNYIFLNSAVDILFLLIQSFLVIIRCGVLCPYGYTYVAKFYEIYIYLYVGYVLVSSEVFLNIYVTFDRFKMFSGKMNNQKQLSIYIVYAICVLISIVANALPYLIAKQVVPLGIYMPNPNSTYTEMLYVRAFRQAFETPLFQNLQTAILIIKDSVMFTVLCVLNFILALKFRAYVNSRQRLIKRTQTGLRI